MPSTLSDPLYERLLHAFPADRAYTPNDWDAEPMPASVRHFLVHYLRRQGGRETDHLHVARSAWVDYDHPEVEQAERTLRDALVRHTRIPHAEWADALQQATRRVVAYLVQPVPVLTDFAFEDEEEEIDLRQVQERMQFFLDYPYLREAVQAFAEQRDLETIRRDAFERFLERIDERMGADCDTDRWLDLLDPLFALARIATSSDAVPVRLLRLFFNEKDADGIVRRLRTYEREGRPRIDPQALREILIRHETEHEEHETEPAAAPAPGADQAPEPDPPREREEVAEETVAEAVGEEIEEEEVGWFGAFSDDESPLERWSVARSARPVETQPEDTTEEHPEREERPERTVEEYAPEREAEDGDGAKPLWKQFQRGTGPTAPLDVEEPGKPLWAQFRAARQPEGYASDEQGTAAGGKVSAAGVSVQSEQARLEALERAVLGERNPPHRDTYVRQLFNGSIVDYQRTLSRLESTSSWGEASQIIARDVFRAHKVNIYSDAAVHFTNAVEERFRR